jgi:hypothetical protein
MKTLHRNLSLTLLAAALAVPGLVCAQDRDRQYEDRAHHDSHRWNDQEDQAYRRFLKERNKKYHDFAKANRREQDDYWKWRHSHPDNDHR